MVDGRSQPPVCGLSHAFLLRLAPYATPGLYASPHLPPKQAPLRRGPRPFSKPEHPPFRALPRASSRLSNVSTEVISPTIPNDTKLRAADPDVFSGVNPRA